MHFKKILVTLVFISFLSSCKENQVEPQEPQIIPAPVSLQVNTGHFVLNSSVGVQFDDEFHVAANYLKAFIKDGSKNAISISNTSNEIVFIKDSSIKNKEGYALNITKNNIEIKASTPSGAFYAVQSLRQLLPPEFENGSYANSEVNIQNVSIEDEPRFVYRGMHLDVGRHMFSVDFIKKYIDAIAMLKMNTFHWHLTEDQGWRIEIKKYPKLQEVAAFRKETLIGHYRDQPHQFDKKKYGGYYTQEEIKEVVAYAQEHSVTVIPEIELPGHSQAALSAYPELGCTDQPIDVATKWGVVEDIYCTKDSTFNFLEDVLDEVIALFPSKYIHIGGDEAPKTRWKSCKNCQQRIKEEGLKDEHELQNYFITRIEKYLNSKGRQIIGWDEILEGGLAPNATVMSWRGINGAIEAAKQHHNVVMTPTSHCYFDYYQSENENEPLAIGGYLPLEKVYSFNPIPDELTEDEQQYVLGAQGNVWTEYISTPEKAEYMAFPRAIALSEVVWSKTEQINYEAFIVRLENFHKRLNALDINYANHLYEIEGVLLSKQNELTYQLKTLIKEKNIRYTVDNTEPSIDSKIYNNPITITKNQTIKAAVFNSEEKLGETFVENIKLHKAVGKQITINKEPNKSYPGSGAQGLINGISGSDTRYGDKEWLGFWGDDIEITIDLGEEMDVNCIQTRFYKGQGQWIYCPNSIQIGMLDENKNDIYGMVEQFIEPYSNNCLINSWCNNLDNNPIRGRYIKLNIQNYGIIPDGKQGAGNKAWTFIDEIIVN